MEKIFSEDDLQVYAIGHLNEIEGGLILKRPKQKLGKDEPDIWCVDKDGRDVFVELEWNPASDASVGQVIKYKSRTIPQATEKYALRNPRLIFFVPDIDPSISNQLNSLGIKVKTFDKPALTKKIKVHSEARIKLKEIRSILDSTITVTIAGRPKEMDTIKACYYYDYVKDPLTGKKRRVGLGKPTIGFMLEMTKVMCNSEFFHTNPVKLGDLIFENLSSPIYYQYRGKEHIKNFNQWTMSSTYSGIKPVQEKVAKIIRLLKEIRTIECETEDLLVKIAKELVQKTGSRKVDVKSAFDFIMDKFSFSSIAEARGVSYANNMAIRILELMSLTQLCFINPGPGRFHILVYDGRRRVFKKLVPINFEFILIPKLYRNPTTIIK